jgi:hypothetical protein
MDREILGIFLQSGPARKFDVSRFTRTIVTSGVADQPVLFRNKFLNYAILFKCIILDDYAKSERDKSISTLVYMPYDSLRPNDGGESFVFSPADFSRYCAHKLHTANIDLMAVEYDLELLKILDSLPTFSPLIVELALERNNMAIPNAYLDLTPELRVKLRAQLKGRIRPLIVAAYDKSSVSVEKAVEEMTGKLFSLHNVREILPLVQALRLPPENAIESDLVYNGEIAKFSKFLLKCKEAYWELGDLLGRFEQTAIAWRVFNTSYHGKRIPFSILINFFVLLRKLHDAPPKVDSSGIDERPAEGTGFPHFAPNLF